MFAPILLFIGLGCRSVDPAPEDIDGLLHFIWAGTAAGDDAALAEAVLSLDPTAAGLDEVLDGNISRLSSDEVAMVSGVDADPALAAGIFMLNRFSCDPDRLRELLIDPDQDLLREGTYTDYDRRFTSDRAAYERGESPTLSWEISISAQVVLSDYSSELSGDIRDLDTDLGPAFVQRSWFTEPAVFQNNNTWEQDYQLELYYEAAPGEIVHLYGMWRQLDVAGFTSESSGVQRQVLNGMKDWDDETEALCAQ